MKWVLYDFKTAKEPWFDSAEEVYQKKIKPYTGFELFHLKTLKADRGEAELKKNFEAKVLLEKLSSDDFIILLDQRGKKYDSIEFSKLINTAQDSGKKRGVFIIGGAYGVNDIIKNRSQKIICLSDMTMNHLVAELMLLEQFYRALTIINRIPYHNQ